MKSAFKQNMGMLDRVLRVCAGIVLLVLATFVVTGVTAVVLLILTIPLLIPLLPAFAPVILFLVYPRSGNECLKPINRIDTETKNERGR